MTSVPRHERARRGFRPGLLPTLMAVLGVAVLLALGSWQVQRLYWKQELIATRAAQLAAEPVVLPARIDEPGAWDFRRVVVEGRPLVEHAQYYGAAGHQGRFGHHLLVPLERDDGSVLLVDHGWVPAEWRAERRVIEDDPVRIKGILRDRSAERPGLFTPDNEPGARLWYWYDLDALRTATGLALLPVVLEAARGSGDDPPIGGRTVVELPNNHLGYAITWYGLAAALVAIYLVYGLRAGRAP